VGRIIGDLKERTLRFGEAILAAIATMPNEPRAWIVGRQLGRSGTSVGANVWEADVALTDAEFANKISIARKEASEAQYWLELSTRSKLITCELYAELHTEACELGRVLGTIVRKTQQRSRRA
jgi:four helix bundle protein